MKQKYKKIYVLCPSNTKTGGTELLHQLVWQINSLGGNANIVYFNDSYKNVTITKGFERYVNSFLTPNDIEDQEGNAVVIPENSPRLLGNVHNCTKYFWWLSVDNFVRYHTGVHGAIFEKGAFLGVLCSVKRIFAKTYMNDANLINLSDYHLCQSYYAIDYVSKKIKADRIFYLSDYINDIYIDGFKNIYFDRKENVVLYNPKKGYSFTKKIIKHTPNIKWVPLQNMSTQEVQQTLKNAKVYIDFGNFPGKDRFPREAAMSGCCVIIGNKGAASYIDDFPIDKRYKFKNDNSCIPSIISCILDCFDNFETNFNNFKTYRNAISAEKSEFIADVKKIFFDKE